MQQNIVDLTFLSTTNHRILCMTFKYFGLYIFKHDRRPIEIKSLAIFQINFGIEK